MDDNVFAFHSRGGEGFEDAGEEGGDEGGVPAGVDDCYAEGGAWVGRLVAWVVVGVVERGSGGEG